MSETSLDHDLEPRARCMEASVSILRVAGAERVYPALGVLRCRCPEAVRCRPISAAGRALAERDANGRLRWL